MADRRRRRPRVAWALLLCLIAVQSAASAGSATVAGVRVPKGYRVVQKHRMGSGVWHVALQARSPKQIVHVARLQRSALTRVKVLLSNGQVSGPNPRTEPTSRMCRRVRCALAINGGFFNLQGVPVGGVISGGRPIRSPLSSRPQFTFGPGGRLSIGKQTMATWLVTQHQLLPTHRFLSRSGQGQEARFTDVLGVNVARPADGIVLYTPAFGPTTETRGGTEILARIVDPSGPLHLGVDTTIELVSSRAGGTRIPADGVVLSGDGDGASALSALWREVKAGRADRFATIRVDVSPQAVESVAGRELLVRRGDVVATPRTARAPRTMIGWNRAGDLLLVTVDGRQTGRAVGLTMVETAKFMRAIGAVEALNLDGGGSTTFVRNGKVLNRPSDARARERWVALAVAVLP